MIFKMLNSEKPMREDVNLEDLMDSSNHGNKSNGNLTSKIRDLIRADRGYSLINS